MSNLRLFQLKSARGYMIKRDQRLNRREFIRAIAWTSFSLGLGGTSYATLWEPTWVKIERIPLYYPNLHPDLEGIKILQLSDIHLSKVVSRPYVRHCIQMANQLKPDIILLTGDYVTRVKKYIHPVAEELGHLKSPLGTYAVLGNHDYWTHGPMIKTALRKAGIKVLVNQHTRIQVGDTELWVLGVDDLWAGVFDLNKTFTGTPADRFRILLMHNPDEFEEAAEYNPDLILSGHTHGGQVAIPFYGPIMTPSRHGNLYASGLFQKNTTVMYVNQGLGLIAPPVRLGVRPEISLFTLLREPATAS